MRGEFDAREQATAEIAQAKSDDAKTQAALNHVLKLNDELLKKLERANAKNHHYRCGNCGERAFNSAGIELIDERDELRAENQKLLERYRNIELANKEMTRNDHVVFGDLLIERDSLRTACLDLAGALEMSQCVATTHHLKHYTGVACPRCDSLAKHQPLLQKLKEEVK